MAFTISVTTISQYYFITHVMCGVLYSIIDCIPTLVADSGFVWTFMITNKILLIYKKFNLPAARFYRNVNITEV